jgi:hypothetical protein
VEGVAAAATRRVVAALLAAGADPLATTVRHQCSALRCACGSAQLGNGALEVMLAHLEQRRVAGHLALPSGDAAADLMVAAARRRCRRLFVVAHEYVVAACGLRLRQQGAAAAAARAAAEERRAARRCSSSDDSSSSTDSSNDDEGGGGRSSAAQASCTASAPGVLAGLLTEAAAQPPPPPRAPAWQPTTVQLFETLRSAALGGCPAILRCILASPLPFSLAGADAQGHGLLALCAVHADSDPPFAVLHAAGARLSLARLLFLLERRVPPERLSALLALQRPAVSQQAVWLQAGGVRCWACPIHRLLRMWEVRGAGQPAPSGSIHSQYFSLPRLQCRTSLLSLQALSFAFPLKAHLPFRGCYDQAPTLSSAAFCCRPGDSPASVPPWRRWKRCWQPGTGPRCGATCLTPSCQARCGPAVQQAALGAFIAALLSSSQRLWCPMPRQCHGTLRPACALLRREPVLQAGKGPFYLWNVACYPDRRWADRSHV